MSEISEPLVTEKNTAAVVTLSHRRILWTMTIVLLIGVVFSLIYAERSFTIGLIIGGILAFVNYYWLKISLKNLFDAMAQSGGKPRFLAAKYFLRYATLGVIVWLAYVTKFASVVAVLLGLASIALAVTIEGLIRIFTTNSSKRGEF